MKIALIGRYGEGEIAAGPERVARELYSELKRNNSGSIFIEYFFSGYKDSSFLKKIFGKEYLEEKRILRLGIFPLLMNLLRERYEIIHLINSQRFLLFILLMKPFIKSKFTATLHGFLKYEIPSENYWSKRYFIDLWVERLIVRRSDLLIFPSAILLNSFMNHYKDKFSKYQIIPNGIGKFFSETKKTYPPVTDSINAVFFNGSAGSIRRGLKVVYNLLIESNNKINLFIIGEEDPGLQSTGRLHIIFKALMNQRELISFLKDKHVIVKGPAFDTFPVGVAECMALGIIPVLTDKNGLIDYIEDGINGFIYNESPESENTLLKILDKFFEGKFDLGMISCNAEKIYEQLNWEKIAEQYIFAYQSAL